MASQTIEFKITKKLRSNYTITPPPTSSQPYTVDIGSHDSADTPFIFMFVGTKPEATTNAVSSVRPSKDSKDSGAFEITCNADDGVVSKCDEDINALAILRHAGAGEANLEVGMADGNMRELVWRRSTDVSSSINLLDITSSETVLATFEEDFFLGRGGKLKLNVDWGLSFERIVLTSFIACFERTSVWGQRRADIRSKEAKGEYLLAL